VLAGFVDRGVKPGSWPLTLEVRDALGTRARRDYTVWVVASGALRFLTHTLPDAMVGQDYRAEVQLTGGAAGLPPAPLSLTSPRALPDGLALLPSLSGATLEGRPQRAGVFTVDLSAQDGDGDVIAATFVVSVLARSLELGSADVPSAVLPGEPVAFRLSAPEGTVFSLYAGALPPGLSLSNSGVVSGTVSADAAPGSYDFTVRAIGAAGETGLAPLVLVVAGPWAPSGCHCATSDELVGALLAALMLYRRRRPTST
jgi:hypothetical protein